MSFTIRHRILFELNIWHHFFLDRGMDNYVKMDPDEKHGQIIRYDAHQLFSIEPTPSCVRELKRHQLVLKNTSTGLLVLGKEHSSGNTPWIPFNHEMKLTFILRILNEAFYNFSELSIEIENDEIYYFHNVSEAPGYLIPLSKKLPDDPDEDELLYIGKDWLLPLLYPLYNVNLPGGSKADISLLKYSNFSFVQVFQKTISNDEDISATRQIDFRHLDSGFYQLNVSIDDSQTMEKFVFLNNEGLGKDTFGVVEVFGRNAADNYALLNEDGTFKPQLEKKEEYDKWPQGTELPARFELRLDNRKTHWQYFHGNNQVPSLEVGPYPLTRHGNIEVLHHSKLLPNPIPSSIDLKLKSDGTIEKYISKIYLP